MLDESADADGANSKTDIGEKGDDKNGADDVAVPTSRQSSAQSRLSADDVSPPDDNDKARSSEEQESRNKDLHFVTATVTVAVAYPKPSDEHSKLLEELAKKNKKTLDAPRPTQFFRCEYQLEPAEEETCADVVTYAVAAKVFTDSDVRVVRTWDDGNNVWVAWMQSHEIQVTSENVLGLYDHAVDVKLWSGKEKLSNRAKTDRPKAFRLPSANDSDNYGRGVQSVVRRQSQNWLKAQPRDSFTNVIDALTSCNRASLLGEGAGPEERPGLMVKSEKRLIAPPAVKPVSPGSEGSGATPLRVRSSLGRYAGIDVSNEEKKRTSQLKQEQNKLTRQLAKKPAKNDDDGKKANKTNGSFDDGEGVKCVNLKIKLQSLFADERTKTVRLPKASGPIRDAFASVTLSSSLLPDHLARRLNPLVVKLKSVKALPDKPVPVDRLSQECEPLFCKYSFLGHEPHRTDGRLHNNNVYFEDSHVILLGRVNECDLREYILSNSFQVEIHDRDLLPRDDVGAPAIYGTDPGDRRLTSPTVGGGGARGRRRSSSQAVRASVATPPFHHHGVARVSLVDILRGKTVVHAQASVLPCPAPSLRQDGKDPDARRSALDPDRLPPGHYIQAETLVKMKFELRFPLVAPECVPKLMPMQQQMGSFARVVLRFAYANKRLLAEVEELVTASNARALNMTNFDNNVVEAALSTYKLTAEQKAAVDLDIVTGFLVIDGVHHIAVLEGLRDRSIPRLIQLIHNHQCADDELVRLYDSSMTFTRRLYGDLDVNLCRVRLHQPLAGMMGQPLIYMRDMIPSACLACLVQLHEMTQQTRFRDVVYAQLFPTPDMIRSMSREFGVALTYADFEAHHEPEQPDKPHPGLISDTEEEEKKENTKKKKKKKRVRTALDNSNQAYEAILQARQEKMAKANMDYVSKNVDAVARIAKLHPAKFHVRANVPGFNYSTQSLNSTDAAKDLLRRMLAETDPDARFTYHTGYNSAILDPVDVDEFHKEREREAKRAWRVSEGFIYPGPKSGLAANQHAMRPDLSRVDELKLPFRDNILHGNVLEPTLTERCQTPWEERTVGMERYRKPPSYFGKPPATIHLAGERRRLEELVHKKAEKQRWKARMVVDDARMRFHRLLPASERKRDAANQIDRLGGLLKDQPAKRSLRHIPAPAIPPLHVISNPGVDATLRNSGLPPPAATDDDDERNVGFIPGAYDNVGWKMERNKIPIPDDRVDPERSRLHAENMRLHFTEQSILTRPKQIAALKPDEINSHLFKLPPDVNTSKAKVFEGLAASEENSAKFGGSSEYRQKFAGPPDGVNPLPADAIYPRPSFHGFAAAGSDVAKDATVALVGGSLRKLSDTDFNKPDANVRLVA